jgi:hypothetical protein
VGKIPHRGTSGGRVWSSGVSPKSSEQSDQIPPSKNYESNELVFFKKKRVSTFNRVESRPIPKSLSIANNKPNRFSN